MPTRCNRGFYCRSYCLLNMFRAPLCPSSGAQEYYTVVAALWYFVLWFSSCWSGVELRVMCPVCRMLQHVEQTIRSAIKTSVTSSWHFISTYLYLPTEAQESCFKRILKFTLKQLLHVSVQSPSSGSALI